MHLLKISTQEWLDAKNFFNNHPNATKMSKKVKGCPHSFIKVKGRIVAIGYFLGAGTFGVVKVAEDDTGKNYAIKAEGGALTSDDIKEEKILQLMGYSYGMVERQLDSARRFYPNHPSLAFVGDKKKYKLLELLEGQDLTFELYDKYAFENLDRYVPIHKLNDIQKLTIAVLTCQRLMQLQKLRIIHADIKTENTKVNIQPDNIALRFMDFGLSMILPEGATSIVGGYKGSRYYMAPEIISKGIFSFASDVYAAGIMFSDNLELDYNLCEGMLKDNPLDRDTPAQTITKLLDRLELIAGSDITTLNFIKDVRKELQGPTQPQVFNNSKQPIDRGQPVQIMPNFDAVKLKPVQPKPQQQQQENFTPKMAVQLKPITPKVEPQQQPNESPKHAVQLRPVVIQTPKALPAQKKVITPTPNRNRPLPTPNKNRPLPTPKIQEPAIVPPRENQIPKEVNKQMANVIVRQKEPTPHAFAKLKPSEMRRNHVAQLQEKLQLNKEMFQPMLQKGGQPLLPRFEQQQKDNSPLQVKGAIKEKPTVKVIYSK